MIWYDALEVKNVPTYTDFVVHGLLDIENDFACWFHVKNNKDTPYRQAVLQNFPTELSKSLGKFQESLEED